MNEFVYLCFIVGQMFYSTKLNQGYIGHKMFKMFRSIKCGLTESRYDNGNMTLID